MRGIPSTLVAFSLAAAVPASAQTVNGHSASPIARAIEREAARLAAEPDGSIQIQSTRPNVERQNWFARHPVAVGAIAGLGVGTAWSLHDSANSCDSQIYVVGCNPSSGENGLKLLLGAGVGALAGLVVRSAIGSGLTYEAGRAPESDTQRVQYIVRKLGDGAKVTVARGDAPKISGRIESIGDDDFSFVPEGGAEPVSVQYRNVRSIQPRPLNAAAKAGIAGAVITPILITVAYVIAGGGGK